MKEELDVRMEHSTPISMKTTMQGDLSTQQGLAQSDTKRMDFTMKQDNPGVSMSGTPAGKSGGNGKHMTSEFSSLKTGNGELYKSFAK
jgi:hypothetical protein